MEAKDNKFNNIDNLKYSKLMPSGELVEIFPAKDIIKIIEVKFEDLYDKITRLKMENKYLKDSAYESKELADMKERLEKMQADYYRGFPITKEESEKIREWQKNHTEKMHGAKTLEEKLKLEGVSGGRWTYEFVPTSIGTIGVCACEACKSKAYMKAGNPANYKSYDKYHETLTKLIKKYDAEFEFQKL